MAMSAFKCPAIINYCGRSLTNKDTNSLGVLTNQGQEVVSRTASRNGEGHYRHPKLSTLPRILHEMGGMLLCDSLLKKRSTILWEALVRTWSDLGHILSLIAVLSTIGVVRGPGRRRRDVKPSLNYREPSLYLGVRKRARLCTARAVVNPGLVKRARWSSVSPAGSTRRSASEKITPPPPAQTLFHRRSDGWPPSSDTALPRGRTKRRRASPVSRHTRSVFFPRARACSSRAGLRTPACAETEQALSSVRTQPLPGAGPSDDVLRRSHDTPDQCSSHTREHAPLAPARVHLHTPKLSKRRPPSRQLLSTLRIPRGSIGNVCYELLKVIPLDSKLTLPCQQTGELTSWLTWYFIDFRTSRCARARLATWFSDLTLLEPVLLATRVHQCARKLSVRHSGHDIFIVPRTSPRLVTLFASLAILRPMFHPRACALSTLWSVYTYLSYIGSLQARVIDGILHQSHDGLTLTSVPSRAFSAPADVHQRARKMSERLLIVYRIVKYSGGSEQLKSSTPMEVKRGKDGAATECNGWGTGVRRENPPVNGNVCLVFPMRKSRFCLIREPNPECAESISLVVSAEGDILGSIRGITTDSGSASVTSPFRSLFRGPKPGTDFCLSIMPRKLKSSLSRVSSQAQAKRLARSQESSEDAELRRQEQAERKATLRAAESPAETSAKAKRSSRASSRSEGLRDTYSNEKQAARQAALMASETPEQSQARRIANAEIQTERRRNFLSNTWSVFNNTAFNYDPLIDYKMTGFSPKFTLRGHIYHRLGSFLPADNLKHKFLELRKTVLKIQRNLHEHIILTKTFKTALRNMRKENYEVVIYADRTPHGEHEKRYNSPLINEIAAVGGDLFLSRDIVLRAHDNTLTRVADAHNDKKDIILKFHFLTLQQNNLFRTKKFLESERLSHISLNQKNLRVENYIHLQDAVSTLLKYFPSFHGKVRRVDNLNCRRNDNFLVQWRRKLRVKSALFIPVTRSQREYGDFPYFVFADLTPFFVITDCLSVYTLYISVKHSVNIRKFVNTVTMLIYTTAT
ncbi:hypothetical protein PR048_015035 [Dryococelus australis]|uniref:Uncharacterized protein n=1 Tax=Dryococelus australis TaxID=614101 RepID=A0ABQ9HG39_9NEOP|nr:hypothetical protein PR048_015035 [Dryococelus australis]